LHTYYSRIAHALRLHVTATLTRQWPEPKVEVAVLGEKEERAE